MIFKEFVLPLTRQNYVVQLSVIRSTFNQGLKRKGVNDKSVDMKK